MAKDDFMSSAMADPMTWKFTQGEGGEQGHRMQLP